MHHHDGGAADDEGREVAEVMDAATPADRRSAFANAPMGVALCTSEGVTTDANAVLGELLGRTPEDLRGRSVFDLIHPDDIAGAVEAAAQLARQPGRPMRHECRFERADGSHVPVQVAASLVEATPGGADAHLVLIIEDITDRKALEAALVHRSLHDPLTGLPNRILFHDRLRHALERGHRERTPTCVLVIDLDGFKAINDEHGHQVGDAVLVAFAERLTLVLRASDTAARLGGDEFAIVCENTERAEAEVLGDRVRTTVNDPLSIGDQAMTVGMSIGIGSASGGADPDAVYERVVREADDAMYADKARRRP
jgi:diguanylate cyclase (GGDEF)-like protein/PAS domain S-box-containing protein